MNFVRYIKQRRIFRIGYLISGDPGYITSYENARNKMIELDREKVLEIILKDYMRNNI